MGEFAERLNFSDKAGNDSAIELFQHNRDLGYYYDNLSLYCANNNIDLTDVSDEDFMAAAQVMENYGSDDKWSDRYFFWID